MQDPDTRAPARRGRRKSIRASFAGTLHGDLGAVAMKLHEALHQADITVWANANSEVLFDTPESCPDVGSQWLAGTYGVGATLGDIEADLQALRRECMPADILD